MKLFALSCIVGLLLLCFQDRIQVVNGALSISSLTLSDTGMYQCIAENRHGRVFANAELRAIGKASLNS